MDKAETIGLACQLAFDYENPGWEHVSDMLATYDETGEVAPCDGDDLHDMMLMAVSLKKEGLSYDEVEDKLRGKT